MGKIKAFFSSTATKAAAWVILAADVACLILGGTSTVEIGDGVGLIAAIVAAASALIAFIAERVKNK